MGLFSSRLTAREMAPMCRQLATSYDAGIPILQGLALAARHSASSKVRGLLGRIHARIRKGATLMDAARVEQKLLPDFFVEVLGAGETGRGRLLGAGLRGAEGRPGADAHAHPDWRPVQEPLHGRRRDVVRAGADGAEGCGRREGRRADGGAIRRGPRGSGRWRFALPTARKFASKAASTAPACVSCCRR